MIRRLDPEPHIVVVDSRPPDYHDLASLAAEHRWHLHFLTSARAAVTFIRRARADLWMINTRLPDMCGFALHAILRDQLVDAATLIISDQYNADEEQLACRSGVTLYLAKSATHAFDARAVLPLLAIQDGPPALHRMSGEFDRRDLAPFEPLTNHA